MTRPRERADALNAALERAGAQPIAFPTIEIEPVEPRLPDASSSPDVVLFVSPAAVAFGLRWLDLGEAAAVGAVGTRTARALQAEGVAVAIRPVGSEDTPGLLRNEALAAPAIAGRCVRIVRGNGGREDLGEALVARGATVDYAEVYRRVRPQGLEPGDALACDVVTLTSNEGASNLLALLDPPAREQIRQRPVVVASARNAQQARGLGFHGPLAIAGGADEGSMLRAIEQLYGRAPPADSGPA